MKPGAHVAAAIDCIGLVNEGWATGSRVPADAIFARYFKERRYIGSKDRGAIASLVYRVLRHGASLEWWLEKAGLAGEPRSLVLAALVIGEGRAADEIAAWLNGETHTAPPLSDVEKAGLRALEGQAMTHPDMPLPVFHNFPDWMQKLLEASLGERLPQAMAALNREAPVDLRVNTLKATREQVIQALEAANFSPHALAGAPNGLRLGKRGALFTLAAFREGWFEMQDEGSQRVAEMVDARPGEKVIDFCAGAGGKTLALAASMKNRGRLLAWDTNESRLSQMPKRLARAGVSNVTLRVLTSESDAFIKRHKFSADRVLIDAPCTGSGTWRRNPDLKWRTSPKDLAELSAMQERIMQSAARLVKPGGTLIYATCSLFAAENEEQRERFLEKQTDFIFERELALRPHESQTDGFYAVRFRRASEVAKKKNPTAPETSGQIKSPLSPNAEVAGEML